MASVQQSQVTAQPSQMQIEDAVTIDNSQPPIFTGLNQP
jgi:hypothetical protein